MDYANTLNLPRTDFPMRANLPQREPQILDKWNSEDIYRKVRERNAGKPTFILHDGPPFSNNGIHMGTAMNKILKDFINRYKSMTGFDTPYIPGWDNHGMPIESAIIKKNKLDRKKMSVSEFRSACHDFAKNFVDVQMGQFRRLGVMGDWENPYLTMSPEFESREVRVFGEMYRKGYIYKGLKPVYWCPNDETALAEAEIEYADDPCTSIFVKFRVSDDLGKFTEKNIDTGKTFFVIWTTTTWTLPGNVAIAVNPYEKYDVVSACGINLVVADALVESTMKAAGISDYSIITSFAGNELEFMKVAHPFLDRQSVVITADYVTMDSGSGIVHIAPGFGVDDYHACLKYGIDIIVPVDDRGYQTADAGKFAGLHYEESNGAILEDLKLTGALLASEKITHSYPHCWRCKKPVIFRATPQWFCSVKAFADKAVEACADVSWTPDWGRERMTQMVSERADWCISRQRNWGLPIPVFYCSKCGKPVCNEETINSVSEIFGRLGSNAWSDLSPKDLLPDGFVCPFCSGKDFTKETDTLDGWFDSGSTHFFVLEKEGMRRPADLYLEGADQYRGWFQSSLLTSVAAGDGKAPYKSILTHGWVVDGEGKAMHKSLGNTVSPEDVISKYGADLVRLWVASSDYQVDVRCSDNIFKQLSEAYRKIRNTLRFLMANLGSENEDFNPSTDLLDVSDLPEIDRWMLSKLNDLILRVRNAYDRYAFHIVYHEICDFCTVEVSKLYADIVKDRIYVEKKDSSERRAAQTTMYMLLSSLVRLIAPILSYTADESWEFMSHDDSDDKRNVMLNDMPDYNPDLMFDGTDRWDRLFEMRDDVLKALEDARNDKLIGKSLDAAITIVTSDEEKFRFLSSFGKDLETVFIVSKVNIVLDEKEGIVVSPAEGEKCVRCWKYVVDAYRDADGDCLCERCRRVIGA